MHVHSIDRLARNAKDLLNLVEEMIGRGVSLKSHKNSLTFTPDSKDHMAKLQLTLLAAFAEFKRELIKERQRDEFLQLRGLRIWRNLYFRHLAYEYHHKLSRLFPLSHRDALAQIGPVLQRNGSYQIACR